MIPLPTASEFQADKAIREIKLAINAAENSNQAGEDCVAVMARGPELYRRVVELEEALKPFADMSGGFLGLITDEHVRVARGVFGLPDGRLSADEQAARKAREEAE